MIRGEKARAQLRTPESLLKQKFGVDGNISAQYISTVGTGVVAGICLVIMGLFLFVRKRIFLT